MTAAWYEKGVWCHYIQCIHTCVCTNNSLLCLVTQIVCTMHSQQSLPIYYSLYTNLFEWIPFNVGDCATKYNHVLYHPLERSRHIAHLDDPLSNGDFDDFTLTSSIRASPAPAGRTKYPRSVLMQSLILMITTCVNVFQDTVFCTVQLIL